MPVPARCWTDRPRGRRAPTRSPPTMGWSRWLWTMLWRPLGQLPRIPGRRGGPGWRRSRPPPEPAPRTTNPPSSGGRRRRPGRCRRSVPGPGDAAGPGAGAIGPTATTSRSTTASGSNGTRMVSRSTSALSPSTPQRGVGSISAADRGTPYRWYGLYTQRPEEDGFFMMRIRVPNGMLTAEQVAAVGRISQRFGRDVCDVTDRQNFQLHWIRIEDVPEIWARLGAVGLTTRQTCGDVTRNIIGCPLADVAGDDILHAHPYAIAVDRRLSGTKEFSNLPRKYKISISGCREQCAVHEVMDIGLVGVEHAKGRRGFDLRVGGGERAVDVCAGITGLFRDYGYRRDHHRARLKFPTGERRGSAKCSNMSICRVR